MVITKMRQVTGVHLGIRLGNLLYDLARNQPRCWWLLYSLFCLFLTSPNTVFGGFPFHGAKAAGMGATFVAVADDPSAITFNPGGLTQLEGTNLYGGITSIIPWVRL
jgi:hypothetical protein